MKHLAIYLCFSILFTNCASFSQGIVPKTKLIERVQKNKPSIRVESKILIKSSKEEEYTSRDTPNYNSRYHAAIQRTMVRSEYFENVVKEDSTINTDLQIEINYLRVCSSHGNALYEAWLWIYILSLGVVPFRSSCELQLIAKLSSGKKRLNEYKIMEVGSTWGHITLAPLAAYNYLNDNVDSTFNNMMNFLLESIRKDGFLDIKQ